MLLHQSHVISSYPHPSSLKATSLFRLVFLLFLVTRPTFGQKTAERLGVLSIGVKHLCNNPQMLGSKKLFAKYTGTSDGIGCLKNIQVTLHIEKNRPAGRAQTWSNTISHAHQGSCWNTEARTRRYYWESLRSNRMGVQNCYPTQTQESIWNTTQRWHARRESYHLDDETHQPNYRWAHSRPQWRDCLHSASAT